MSIKFNSIPPKRLSQTITSSSTSFQMTDILGFDGVPLTSTIVGSIAYGSFQNLIGTQLELFSYDPTTIANVNGINFVSRGLQFNEDGTFASVTTNKLTWVKGVTIVQLGTDAPSLFAYLKNYIDAAVIAGGVPASSTTLGYTKLSVDPVSSPSPIAVGDNDPRIPSTAQATFLSNLYGAMPGTPIATARRTAPSGWFLYDGTAVSRVTYPLTFAAICPSQTATITIASPAVVTANAHGLIAGDKIHFTTTGGLPSGISINTDYYVIAAGLTTNAFEFALSPSGTVVNTTGSQSGVHTVYKSAFGKGDGSTTFNLPDLRGKNILGLGATNNLTLAFEGGAVNTSTDVVAVPDGVFPSQGQPITLTTTGTLPAGLATSTTYYIIRVDSTHVAFAASQSDANTTTPVKVNITDTGSAGGVHTINYALTARSVLGRTLGEETHGVSQSEMASHVHTNGYGATVNASFSSSSPSAVGIQSTGAIGSDLQHNNISPNIQMNWMGIAI